MMTTLFNLFCPLISIVKLEASILVFVLLSCSLLYFLLLSESSLNVLTSLGKELFKVDQMLVLFSSGFSMVLIFNMSSLIEFSYPLTTTLALNFSAALGLWGISVMLICMKPHSVGNFLPTNSPWYLVPFLSLVELVSVVVRPITLCFRLLANMSAGHILLTLVCKLTNFTWLSGLFLCLLELMVSLIQSFVFFMLVSVYLKESMEH